MILVSHKHKEHNLCLWTSSPFPTTHHMHFWVGCSHQFLLHNVLFFKKKKKKSPCLFISSKSISSWKWHTLRPEHVRLQKQTDSYKFWMLLLQCKFCMWHTILVTWVSQLPALTLLFAIAYNSLQHRSTVNGHFQDSQVILFLAEI